MSDQTTESGATPEDSIGRSFRRHRGPPAQPQAPSPSTIARLAAGSKARSGMDRFAARHGELVRRT